MTTIQKVELPEITPQVVHLIDLLKWAREGRLRIPKFQRKFVWRRQDILDLIDSISRHYPIGALFLWGAKPMPEHHDQIGPLKLPDYQGETWLILDGEQRITTLVGVLLRDDPQWDGDLETEDPDRWRVYFDAQPEPGGGFSHLRTGEEPPASYIPAPALLDTKKLIAEANRILHSQERDEAEHWIDRALEVARAIQGYRVPIVHFTTNDLSVAVESFSRLNTRGRSISQDEMFSALTYEENDGKRFYLAGEIDKLQRSMVRSGFGEVDRTILLRAVLNAARLDMYRTDWSRLEEQVESDVRERLPTAVENAGTALQHARAFLRNHGILNMRMLPYGAQLEALCAFFGECSEPTDMQVQLLTRWFWCSSFAGWFGSANPTRVRRLVEELRDGTSKLASPTSLTTMDLEQPALPTPSRFDLRSARVKALVCVLLRLSPRLPDGTPLKLEQAAQLLFERGAAAMSLIFATVKDPNLRSSPANRILDVAPDVPGQAKDWLINLDPSVGDDVLASHAMPADALSLIRNGCKDAFLRARMEVLGKLEREFMQKVGVQWPVSTVPMPSPIDTGDEPALSEESS